MSSTHAELRQILLDNPGDSTTMNVTADQVEELGDRIRATEMRSMAELMEKCPVTKAYKGVRARICWLYENTHDVLCRLEDILPIHDDIRAELEHALFDVDLAAPAAKLRTAFRALRNRSAFDLFTAGGLTTLKSPANKFCKIRPEDIQNIDPYVWMAKVYNVNGKVSAVAESPMMRHLQGIRLEASTRKVQLQSPICDADLEAFVRNRNVRNIEHVGFFNARNNGMSEYHFSADAIVDLLKPKYLPAIRRIAIGDVALERQDVGRLAQVADGLPQLQDLSVVSDALPSGVTSRELTDIRKNTKLRLYNYHSEEHDWESYMRDQEKYRRNEG